jgi:hypothetical protein
MSASGTSRTWRDVRLASAKRPNADVAPKMIAPSLAWSIGGWGNAASPEGVQPPGCVIEANKRNFADQYLATTGLPQLNRQTSSLRMVWMVFWELKATTLGAPVGSSIGRSTAP